MSYLRNNFTLGQFTNTLSFLNYRRSLRIVAESYAIKGLCLEHSATPGGSRFKQVERGNDMVSTHVNIWLLLIIYTHV